MNEWTWISLPSDILSAKEKKRTLKNLSRNLATRGYTIVRLCEFPQYDLSSVTVSHSAMVYSTMIFTSEGSVFDEGSK